MGRTVLYEVVVHDAWKDVSLALVLVQMETLANESLQTDYQILLQVMKKPFVPLDVSRRLQLPADVGDLC